MSKPEPPKKSNLLIIDDDVSFVELIVKQLVDREVRLAATMQEGLKMIDEHAPDGILLDLSLPDSALSKTLASIGDIRRRAKDAWVIVITGHPNVKEIKDQVADSGVAEVLNKDDGFFAKLSDALVNTTRAGACAAQSVVEKIEREVVKLVAPTTP